MFDSVGVGVSTKWNRVSCHARRHQENTCIFVSEDDVKVESFCRFCLSVLHEVSERCARKFSW